ncbi:hypothetical protein ABZ912_55450 [Nonomuraea angiospora]|uniref:hypothetical protein n=1 Tax=Nonomuraea angiospora TaxID=46172 RepID=UPI0033E61CFB
MNRVVERGRVCVEGHPAPFFDVVRPVEPGASPAFRYAITFADGAARTAAGITPRILPSLQEQ